MINKSKSAGSMKRKKNTKGALSDNEEIDEDKAFDSEDEAKYGHFFDANDETESMCSYESSGSSNEDFGNQDDNNEDGSDNGEFMHSLLEKLDTVDKLTTEEKHSRNSMQVLKNISESEFATSVLSSKIVTIDDLVGAISDTKGFKAIQNSMKNVLQPQVYLNGEKHSTTTLAPLPKVHADRVGRKIHYKQQQKEMAAWLAIIERNRTAECLDFSARKNSDSVMKEDLISKFKPETKFELDINAALERAGIVEEGDIQKKEENSLISHSGNDDLGEGKMTMEQYIIQRREVAKVKALLFYEEQKRHRINKIKSKKYRKIRKKQEQRHFDAQVAAAELGDSEVLKKMKEQREIERVKERMSLAHKNTSKWAKHQLRRGKALDVDTRRALSAQIQKGRELENKINNTIADTCYHENNLNEHKRMLIDEAKKILLNTEEDSLKAPKSEIEHADGEREGLYRMKFMQRGLKLQKERVKKDAMLLLEELEEMEGIDETNQCDPFVKSVNAKEKKRSHLDVGNIRVGGGKSRNEECNNKVLSNAGLHVPSLAFGDSNFVCIDESLPLEDESSKGIGSNMRLSKEKINANFDDRSARAEIKVRLKTKSQTDKESKDNSIGLKVLTDTGKIKYLNDQPVLSSVQFDEQGIKVDVQKDTSNHDCFSSKNNKRKLKKLVNMSQDELINRAFTLPNLGESTEEMRREIKNEEKDEIMAEVKETTIVGWGNWAGQGTRTKLGKKDQMQIIKKQKKDKSYRRDEKLKQVFINEKCSKSLSKFHIKTLPSLYQTKSQYDNDISCGIGKEWNVSSAVCDMTRPKVVTRKGKIIKPISKKLKTPVRGPAKF